MRLRCVASFLFKWSPMPVVNHAYNTLRAKAAALQKLRRAKIFLKTATKDLITNDPQITTRRWHLYEKSQLAKGLMGRKPCRPKSKTKCANALRQRRILNTLRGLTFPYTAEIRRALLSGLEATILRADEHEDSCQTAFTQFAWRRPDGTPTVSISGSVRRSL